MKEGERERKTFEVHEDDGTVIIFYVQTIKKITKNKKTEVKRINSIESEPMESIGAYIYI